MKRKFKITPYHSLRKATGQANHKSQITNHKSQITNLSRSQLVVVLGQYQNSNFPNSKHLYFSILCFGYCNLFVIWCLCFGIYFIFMFLDPQNNIKQFDLSAGMKVADIGAGSGFNSFAAAEEVGMAGVVYVIDIQKDLLSKIKNESKERNLRNIEIIWGDAEKENGTRLENESVDAAIVSNLFFQVENKGNFLKEVFRILKPKGKLLFIEWSGPFGGIGPSKESFVPEEKAKKFLEEGGFLIEKKIFVGEYHYGFILIKKP
ncbi:class I SAM-dependent methyltransferase [Patescibacteria group bacterium]|nr:class I SAM-dependent methyltransferase [Patescibacteria group bacterium]MBU4115674.1 class I SAM-dependent methyltransferase [Patescibacteria group bacterium]